MFDDEDDRLLRVLRDPLLWNPPELELTFDIAAIFATIDAEAAEAEALCDALLTGPSSGWPERVSATPGTRTPAMVQELLTRMPALIERRPADALQATSIAMAIADVVESRPDWPDEAILVRAHALRDHAWVLSFLGRYAEALQYAERSERTFALVPGEDFDLARLALVKASALRMQNRSEEAIALTRQAAQTFREYHDRPRYVNARITEAAMLYDGGAVQRALEVWTSVQGDRGLDEIGAVRLTHNIAVCLCDLGRQSEVVASFERCVADFERLGLPTERTRSRWYLANALLGTDRRREAVAMYRTAWREFDQLGLAVDAALTALDLAEALVAGDQPAEVPAICHDVIAQLTGAGLAMQAIPALSLLREAAAMGRASRGLIRRTHAVVERVGRERRLFAPGV